MYARLSCVLYVVLYMYTLYIVQYSIYCAWYCVMCMCIHCVYIVIL